MSVSGTFRFIISLLIFTGICFYGCQKEKYFTGSSVKLTFSVDTLLFDTVFTSIGTVTREFKVYNSSNHDILISSIQIAGSDQTGFRFNVDGRPGTAIEEVPLLANDSLFVFVEASIDPLSSSSPMVITDSVVFITNGNIQDVKLVAWGQDVNLINGEILSTQTWTSEKPYLIYNSALVDTLETLWIDPGARIYFHKGSTFYVSGTLKVLGSTSEPVIFSGDRLDQLYKDIPGQWSGIYFLNGSTGNEILNAQILNATTGIHLGNFYSTDQFPDLKISNSIIKHMTYAGLSSIGATIFADNCEISDCGFFTLVLTTGGWYEFMHCTIANYWNWSQRRSPSVLLSNYYNLNDTAMFEGDLLNAEFGNCIIYGSRDNEIGLSELTGAGEFNYLFNYCLVKADSSVPTSDPMYFIHPYVNSDPGFINIYESDFQLDTLAFAKDKGYIEIANQFPLDLFGNSRLNDFSPDLGAYERIEKLSKR